MFSVFWLVLLEVCFGGAVQSGCVGRLRTSSGSDRKDVESREECSGERRDARLLRACRGCKAAAIGRCARMQWGTVRQVRTPGRQARLASQTLYSLHPSFATETQTYTPLSPCVHHPHTHPNALSSLPTNCTGRPGDQLSLGSALMADQWELSAFLYSVFCIETSASTLYCDTLHQINKKN